MSNKPTIAIIVAASENGVIGKDGGMPWHLPAELAYFKKVTLGHPIIMGRKTHEAIGRALPGRTNIVITSDHDYQAKGCTVVNSLEDALIAAKKSPGADEILVIGGQSINEQAMPFTDKLYLTRVKTQVEGDKYFSFKPSDWRQSWSEKHSADDQNQYDYEFMVFERQAQGNQ